MLEESTILPVISEVLGHQSTESTRYYLRIDLESMKRCMLDAPPVAVDFYAQKALKNHDVNLDESYLRVQDSKNGKERIIPISDSLASVCSM